MDTKVYFKVHRLEALYQQPVSPCLGAGGGGWAWYIQVMQVSIVDTKVDFKVHRLGAWY